MIDMDDIVILARLMFYITMTAYFANELLGGVI